MKNDDAFLPPVPYFEATKPTPRGPDRAENQRQDGALYAEPTPYFALNDAEVSAMRARASELEAELRGLEARGASWGARQRVQSELDEITGRLRTAEWDRDFQRRHETGRDAAPPNVANSASQPGAATVQALALQGRRARVVQGLYGPAVMVE